MGLKRPVATRDLRGYGRVKALVGKLAQASAVALLGSALVLTACSSQAPAAQPAEVAETVILIPGLGGNAGPLESLKRELGSAGYRVVVADIGDGQGDLGAYARDIASTLPSYGPVSVVGYSAGGVIARAINQEQPGLLVRVVTIASPHQGSGLAQLGSLFGGSRCTTACRQLAPGSEFLNSLEGAPDNGTWLSLWTENDEAVTPASNSELDGAVNVKAQDCGTGPLTHSSVVTNPVVVGIAVAHIRGEENPCR